MVSSSTSSTLTAFKVASDSRILEEKSISERRRDCLVLILHHLQKFGYLQTAAQLQIEAETILSHYDYADNIDLLHILADYEDYYSLKYGGEKPRYSRKGQSTDSKSLPRRRRGAGGGHSGCKTLDSEKMLVSKDFPFHPSSEEINGTSHTGGPMRLLPKRPSRVTSSTKKTNDSDACSGLLTTNSKTISITDNSINDTSQHHTWFQESTTGSDDIQTTSSRNIPSLHVGGVTLTCTTYDDEDDDHDKNKNPSSSIPENHLFRTIKAIPSFGGDIEMKALAMTIQREILDQSPGVAWEDIVQLDDAKRLLTEAVILPLKYPSLFQGLLEPWRGVLLYGPSGTGKTLLAKAVASQSSSTFFNVSASSLVSKYRGDSEKLIRVLFSLARHNAPSTIFIDEVDAIMGNRGSGHSTSSSSSHSSWDVGCHGTTNEHEGSRRMKTELLIEMDGLGKGGGRVFVLAATNMPWDLDPAFLRRLEKRILIPMPSKDARKMMMQSHFSGVTTTLTEENYNRLAILTEGFSGADIKLLCKEAAMRPVREIIQQIESLDKTKRHSKGNPIDMKKMSQILLNQYPINMEHFEGSLSSTKSSIGFDLCQKYLLWNNQFGSI